MNKKLVASLILTALVSACGGGGGGGGSASPAQTPSSNPPATSDPDTDFSAGIFEPYQNFEQICESPRSGADSRGRPFTDSQGTSTDENYWLR
ncbi:MAG: peptidase, partial [Gammaproteobacteria bacterium]|nr:peptidase [Gammaproteobacteria bacterium]